MPLNPLQRRNALKLLVGATSIAPLQFAQQPTAITTDDVRGAARIAGEPLTSEQLQTLTPALSHHLKSFEPVRDLDIDDAISPPAIFRVR